MHRYYKMEIVPGLFDDWGLVREWGSIGRAGQVRTDWFASEAETKDARFALNMQKAIPALVAVVLIVCLV